VGIKERGTAGRLMFEGILMKCVYKIVGAAGRLILLGNFGEMWVQNRGGKLNC
jgi:hypothetical protein